MSLNDLALIQQALSVDSFATWDTALKTLGGFAIIYMGRGFGKMQKEMTEWRVHLFGINGDNGINGNVKMLMKEREDALKAGSHLHRRDDDR